MRLYRSDAASQEREKDIRTGAVMVSMSLTKLSLGMVASLPSSPRFTWQNHCTRIVIGGVILDQHASSLPQVLDHEEANHSGFGDGT